MKKAIWIGSIVLLAGAIGGGVWGWQYAQKEAQKEFRRAITRAELSDKLRYGKVSFNPISQVLTVEDVRLTVGQDPRLAAISPTIEHLEVLEWERKGRQVVSFRIKVHGLSFKVLEAAKSLGASGSLPENVAENPLGWLVALGYTELRGSIDVDQRLDAEDKRLRYSVVLDFEKLGRVTTEMSMMGVSGGTLSKFDQVVRALQQYQLNAAELSRAERRQLDSEIAQQLAALQQEARTFAVEKVALSYADSGLARRIKRYVDITAWRLPGEESKAEITDERREQLVSNMIESGLPAGQAEEIAKLLREFVADPERIEISTEVDAPVALPEIERAARDRGGVGKVMQLLGVTVKS